MTMRIEVKPHPQISGTPVYTLELQDSAPPSGRPMNAIHTFDKDRLAALHDALGEALEHERRVVRTVPA